MASQMPARLRPEDLAGLPAWDLFDLFRALDRLAHPGFGPDPLGDRCYAVFGEDHTLVYQHIFARPPGPAMLACKVLVCVSDGALEEEERRLVADAECVLAALSQDHR